MDTHRNEQTLSAEEEHTFVRFLDIAGHDLRNPIAVLKSHVQLIQRRLNREGGREEDLRDLSRMSYQIERLNVGLDTFLEAARIEQGQFSLVPDTCNLGVIIRRLAAIYGSASRAHTLTFEVPEKPIIATWDSTRVELALAILLMNALKYSSGGDVRIQVTSTPPYARISVTDTGVGVPTGEEDVIFNAYANGSNIENPGIGLGLFVAREIVRKHGGAMGVTTPESGGATFWITLPLAGIPNAAPDTAPDSPATP